MLTQEITEYMYYTTDMYYPKDDESEPVFCYRESNYGVTMYKKDKLTTSYQQMTRFVSEQYTKFGIDIPHETSVYRNGQLMLTSKYFQLAFESLIRVLNEDKSFPPFSDEEIEEKSKNTFDSFKIEYVLNSYDFGTLLTCESIFNPSRISNQLNWSRRIVTMYNARKEKEKKEEMLKKLKETTRIPVSKSLVVPGSFSFEDSSPMIRRTAENSHV
jgi:hypothetical protein